MLLLGGLEVFLISTLFLLAFFGLAARYILKWFGEGYEQGAEEDV